MKITNTSYKNTIIVELTTSFSFPFSFFCSACLCRAPSSTVLLSALVSAETILPAGHVVELERHNLFDV